MGLALAELLLPLELATEAAVLAALGQGAAGAAPGQVGLKAGVEQAAVGPEQELRPAQSLVAE